MNSTTIAQRNIAFIGMIAAFLIVATLGISAAQAQAAMITHQLDLGSTGSDVTSLQTYLATDPTVYPSGRITGYFGPLTQNAVKVFQTQQNIATGGSPSTTGYGRVGPTTMARLNVLIGGGSTPPVSVNSAPFLSIPTVQVSNTSATVMWNTNEVTQGQVYWSTSPLQVDEATGPHQLPFVSGTLVQDSGGTMTHSVAISGLQANTTYYFMVRSIDSSGDMSLVLPMSFHTNN